MANDDLFGIRKERRIIASGVRQVFTPHQPIDSVQLLFGREAEVSRLIEQISTPGQHALLFGDRGVGKSSLANITRTVVFEQLLEGRVFFQRCDSMSTFDTLVSKPLAELGISPPAGQLQHRHKQSGEAGLEIPLLSAGVSSERETVETSAPVERLSPAWAAEKLREVQGLLLVDEADALHSSDDRHRLAEFIKQLSDSHSRLKVLVVGIARTGDDLIAGHQSVGRCLKETHLDCMRPSELAQIVEKGARGLSLEFTDAVLNEIVDISAGYPHFTHLLALKCAEGAIADGVTHIDMSNLKRALAAAATDAEASLRSQFDNAVRSQKKSSYEDVLFAAAQLGKVEFSAGELRGAYKSITGATITQQSLNNYFAKLVGDDDIRVLRRTAHGVYRFTDPRMPSYIRIRAGARQFALLPPTP